MTYTCKDTQTLAPGLRKPALPRVRPRFAGLSRSAVALFRVGTYRARVAAALMIVAGGLLYQTGAEALEQSSKEVLYLDAPSVSVPQAQNAGETARGYAGSDSKVDDAVLAWVDVKPMPQEASKAFASITDPSGQPPGGVSYDAALAAGDTMVAQIGGDTPAGEGRGGQDDELASADPVRPKLGDGTKATDAPNKSDVTGQQPGAMGTGSQQPEYATTDNPTPSDLGLPAPMAEEYAPPAEQPTAEQPSDSSDSELAAVPEDASEDTGKGTSVTGPISDDYAPNTASPDSSDGSAGEATSQDETKSGSSDVGAPDAQKDEASPTIIVSDSPASDDEPETSDTGISEPENTGTPPNEPSSDPSIELSPASTAEESVPAQDNSPDTDEQEPEKSSDLVAVVPYDPGADESQDESQEGLEQSSQPPAELPTELPEEAAAESLSRPSTDETESYSPEPDPGQQGEFPEQAAATPKLTEEESKEEEPDPQSDAQPGTDPNAELGAGEDMGTDDELPEGVQIESSDEAGVQKLSVVVHQESDATDTQAGDSLGAQVIPEPSPPGPKDGEDHPSNGRGQNPNAKPAPQPNNAQQPDTDQPDDAGGRRPGDHTEEGNNAGNDSPAPQQAPGEQQQPAPQASPNPSAEEQVQPETTPQPTTGNEAAEPEPAPVDQGRQSNQHLDQERVSKQDPRTTAPAPAPAPKDQAPRPDTEGAGQEAQSNDQVQDPTQNRDAKEGEQQLPQPSQQQPFQAAREPRQNTAPVEASPEKVSPGKRGDGTGAQGPTQSADAGQISTQTAPTGEPTAEPEATPETAPAVEISVKPATEEVADPTGWVDPTQAAAARQSAKSGARRVKSSLSQPGRPTRS